MHPVIEKLTGDLSFHICVTLTLYKWFLCSAQLRKTIMNQHIKRSWRTTYKILLSIELDKCIFIDNLSPKSTRSCFKYLRSFSLVSWPNRMHWKHIKASTTNIHVANLFNSYFSSVYQTSSATFLPTVCAGYENRTFDGWRITFQCIL